MNKEQRLLRRNLRHHLGYNHFPPVHESFDAPVLTAIELAGAGQWTALIELPNGVSLTVGEIVEQLHLDFFVEIEDEG